MTCQKASSLQAVMLPATHWQNVSKRTTLFCSRHTHSLHMKDTIAAWFLP